MVLGYKCHKRLIVQWQFFDAFLREWRCCNAYVYAILSQGFDHVLGLEFLNLYALQRLGSLDGMRTFWDFDGRFTAPLHGYADASDYYRRASSRYFLPNIRVPTLLIQAEDDPFVFRHSVPELGELSATTTLELHRTGGHVGFVEGMPHKPRYYLERRIPEWLAQPHMASRVDSTSQHEGFELKVL